jgi:hypothetical protein
LARARPGVEDAISYGTPSLKVGGKFLARLRPDGVLVIRVDFSEREALLAEQPDVFSITEHYIRSPAVLVRLDKVRRDQIARLLEQAWSRLAPKSLLREKK